MSGLTSRFWGLALVLGLATEGQAAPWSLSYGGRLTGVDGSPVAGTVALKVRFYDAATDGTQLGAELDVANVTLVDGVFQTPLALDAAGMQAVFGAGAAYIEVTDVTHGKTYPRQMFNAVPMALRVPVDGTTIQFNDAGALTVPAAPAPPSAGAAQSGYLSSADWVRFNGAPQKSYVDGLSAAQATGVASLSTGLAASSANIAGLSTGLAASVANVASLSTSLATTNTNLTTTNTNLTTTNTNLTALSNAALKKDGSVALTNPWNVGGQDVTNTGNLTMAGSKVFGLSVATSDPGNLTAGDIGKIWYNGGIKLWNGTSAQSLGIAGAGLMSINSLNSGTQTLSNAVTGTTPAWNSAGSTHTLNIPMANAGGTVTAGLISNGEWVLFNGKQNVLPAANAVTNGYLSGGDWTVFNAKQPLLPPGSFTANGYLASADWAVFNAKQNSLGAATGGGAGYLTAGDWSTFNGREPAVTAGSTAQYYRGDKTWQTLATGSVVETSNLYYTTVRAQADARSATSASAPLQYNAGTGVVSLPPATFTANGYLASGDWATFNAKQAAGSYVLTTRNVNTNAPLTGGGNLSGDLTLALAPATISANGYLASGDWLAFNGKQANLGYAPVNKAGDTMTGLLTLPANGLAVGSSQLSMLNGNLGIGLTNPTTPLSFANVVGDKVSFVNNGNGDLYGIGIQASEVRNFAGNAVGNRFTFGYLTPGTTNFNEWMRIQGGNVGIGTTNPGAALDITGTGAKSALILPRDTTTNRPAAPANGMVRYNTTTAQLEGYAAGTWGTVLASNFQCGQWMTASAYDVCVNILTGRILYTSGAGWVTWATANQAAWTAFATGGPYLFAFQTQSNSQVVVFATNLANGQTIYAASSTSGGWTNWQAPGDANWPP